MIYWKYHLFYEVYSYLTNQTYLQWLFRALYKNNSWHFNSVPLKPVYVPILTLRMKLTEDSTAVMFFFVSPTGA